MTDTNKKSSKGQRVGYLRVSTLDQSTARQLEGQDLDEVFERVSGAVYVVKADRRLGSAVAISETELLTNCHVVKEEKQVKLHHDKAQQTADVVSMDEKADRCILRAAILRNVEESLNDVVEGSPILKKMLEEREIGLVGAYYELASGRVHFSEPVLAGHGGTR